METYWRVNEVAAALQISAQTVYRYVANGELPFHKLSRAVRFKPSEIERWMESRKAGVMAGQNENPDGGLFNETKTGCAEGRETNKNCKYFDYCSAPMCPRDAGAAKTVWFAGEPICRLHDVPEWVKRQRKIAKTGMDETAGCFTLPMLERRCVIGKKTTGIDADGTEAEREEAEKDWLDRHPPVKAKSDGERKRLAARMRLLRGNPSWIG